MVDDAPKEEPPVDIHKAKPWHGVREFLKEYVIIVVGVLTALGAEQAVEALHHHVAAGEAREAIRSEIAGDLGQMVFRMRSDDCTKTRLGETEALIRDWSETRSIPQPIWIGRPTTWELKFSRYQSTISDGRAALFTAGEQATYATFYAHARTFLEAQERERPAWARLQVLESAPKYNAFLQSELLLSLQEAKYDRARASSAVRQTLRDVRGLKIDPNQNSLLRVVGTPSACIPLHTERAAALDLFYGKGDRSAEP
jgi:hypothetical protein